MNIKCRYSGLMPDAVVMVCTVRALKMHSGRYRVVAGRPLDPGLTREDLESVEDGCANLDKQIENVRLVRRAGGRRHQPLSDTDTPAEIELIRQRSIAAGAEGAHVSEVWARGRRRRRGAGAGGARRRPSSPSSSGFLYELDRPIKEKIETIATRIYGADGVDYLPCRRSADQEVHRPRLRQPAHLHGQDAPVASPTIPPSRAARADSACRSARSARRWARAFSTRCSARCERCRGCRRSRTPGRSISTTTAMSSASSEVSGAVGDLDGGGVEPRPSVAISRTSRAPRPPRVGAAPPRSPRPSAPPSWP